MAAVSDPALVQQVAQVAIKEALRRAEEVNATDPTLALIEHEEVARLERTFQALVPGFKAGRKGSGENVM